MEKRIGRKEVALLVIVFAVLVAALIGFRLIRRDSGSFVRVTVSGKTVGEYDLSVDREIPIESGGEVTNTLVISGGEADVVYADCPDQICVNASPISAQAETIVCLPNRVVVEVISPDTEAEFDVIAQ